MGLAHSFLEIILHIKEKRNSLVSPRLSKILVTKFGGNAGHNFSLNEVGGLGYGLIHYSLITNSKPKRILCIGSEKGFIPAICALACKKNKVGVVDFVDAGYDKNNKNSWGGTGHWKSTDLNKYFSFLELSSYINTYVTTSERFSKVGNLRWQYIYIDGDHSYEGVKKDYSLYWPKLDRGGFMLFHDVLLKKHPRHPNFGVWKFWQELQSPNKITIPYTLSDITPSGLGILQKR